MLLENGVIIPGKSIGNIKIGMTTDEVKAIIGNDYQEEIRGMGVFVYHLENALIFFDKTQKVFQIRVTNGYKGKFDGKYGIGDNFSEFDAKYGELYEEDYDPFCHYFLTNVPGICFLFSDYDDPEDNWDCHIAPIEWIFVFMEKNS